MHYVECIGVCPGCAPPSERKGEGGVCFNLGTEWGNNAA